MQEITTRSPLEALLTTPETFIGSIMPSEMETYVLFEDSFEFKTVAYVDAWNNCVKEALDNAKDYAKSYIEIDINRSSGCIRVKNDVEEPIPTEKVLSAFCDFLTSSNYENGSGTHIGRNGIGIKGLNAWSKEFRIRSANHIEKKVIEYVCRNNMEFTSTPILKAYNNKSSFVEIFFVLDFDRFVKTAKTTTKNQ